MSLLFKNFSFVEVTYLLIRFKKTMSFLWNTKNTDKNSANERNTHTKCKEKDNFRKGWLVLVSDTPYFFRTTPYFTNPSLFIRKFWTPLFWENFENSNPPLYRWGVPTMVSVYVPLDHRRQGLPKKIKRFLFPFLLSMRYIPKVF